MLKINALTIRAYTTNGDYITRSPEGIRSQGFRLKIGWTFIRLGAWIMYGRKWVNEYKH